MAGPIFLSSFPIRDRSDSSGPEGLCSPSSGMLPNNQLFRSMEPKDPEHLPKDPITFFPLTKDNITTNLPRILRQFYSYDYSHIKSYKAISEQLYTPQAQFDYPVASFHGRDAVTSFWTLFLLQRASQLINVYGLHIDITWDPVKLQALVQLESWHHMTPLAWLDKVLGVPAWKVWTTQLMQFVPSPEDGPGALRLNYQEELLDQHLFLGLIPVGVYSVRTDPGTLLHAVRDNVRAVAGWAVQTGVHAVESVLYAVGWQ